MRYRDEKFYWTYQRGIGWPNDYIGPDSMTQWIIEKSVGFTDVGLLRISESVRAYAYLILSSQASARSSIAGNNKKRSHTQLDSRKQVIAFQDRVITINIKEAQHPLKREKQVIDKSSIMLKISTKSMHRVLV